VDNDGRLLTVSQAIVQGGLDWLVELRHPISNDEESVEAPDWRQVVKVEDSMSDGELIKLYHTLGMVKGRYTVLQNRDAFSFFDRATVEGAAVIKAVGHLDHGRVVWAVAQRPETMELVPGDVIQQNMVLVTAHDGSHAAKVMFAPYRVSTGTMLGYRAARKMRTEVRVRHTKSIDERMVNLHNVLAAESGYFDRWRTALIGGTDSEGTFRPGFKQRVVTQGEIKKVVESLFPTPKRLDEDGNTVDGKDGKARAARELIMGRIEDQQKQAQQAYAEANEQAPNGTTALDVFLGVSEYVAKDRKAKGDGNSWVVSTFGTGANMRQKAFDLIAKL
jgi:phage/plasmid-like protein (TIGR03299 family)